MPQQDPPLQPGLISGWPGAPNVVFWQTHEITSFRRQGCAFGDLGPSGQPGVFFYCTADGCSPNCGMNVRWTDPGNGVEYVSAYVIDECVHPEDPQKCMAVWVPGTGLWIAYDSVNTWPV